MLLRALRTHAGGMGGTVLVDALELGAAAATDILDCTIAIDMACMIDGDSRGG